MITGQDVRCKDNEYDIENYREYQEQCSASGSIDKSTSD